MSNNTKNKGLSRDQAAELYKDLQKTLTQIKSDKKAGKSSSTPTATPISRASASIASGMKDLNFARGINFKFNGQSAAITLLVLFAVGKITLSALQYSGFATVETAQASIERAASRSLATMTPEVIFSKEELEILSQLDKRRAELENRNEKISDREQDLTNREMELTARLTELKSLTDQLKIKREQNDRKKDGQLEQLSKVYSSMAPEEAAKLMEQLDITISLSLLQRMPEKRIAQILALMNSQRALGLTQMLSQ